MEMTEKAQKLPEFLREPLGNVQERLQTLLNRGLEGRKELADRIEKLRSQGLSRASELKGRAEAFRSEALTRLDDLHLKAARFLGVATREEVEELSRELARITEKLGGKKAETPPARNDRARKGRKRGDA